MPLLPTQYAESRRRKPHKRGHRGQQCSFAACAVLSLVYLAYRRTHRAEGAGPGGAAGDDFLGRRDLKERDGAVSAGGAAQYAGPGAVEVFPALPNACRVLLATHSRLLWYRYDTEELTVVHEGQGVYYGGFPGEGRTPAGAPSTLWVVSRPHNWRPTESKEWLLELDAEVGTELRRAPLPSRFTHDTVRRRDRVYAADTGGGALLELAFPSMRLLRRMELFSAREHVNTLAPTADGRMWAMLHNLGPSILAEIDLASGAELRRLEGVGSKSHGAVVWGASIVSLDSDNAALMLVDPATGATTRLWAAPEARRYLKGLCVVDDVALFGVAEAQLRQDRNSTDLNCELAAFDLRERVLLWRRQLPTRGLLNVVAAPHLQVESTAYAVAVANASAGYRATPAYAAALAAARAAQAAAGAGGGEGGRRKDLQRGGEGGGLAAGDGAGAGGGGGGGAPGAPKKSLLELEPLPASDPLSQYPPVLGSRWASGYPRLDLAAKGGHGLASGVQLPLFRADVAALRAAVLALPEADWGEEAQRASNAWLAGRSSNLNQFKPGTASIHLVFSSQSGGAVYEFPWYRERFAALMDPLLRRLLGDDVRNVIRLQLARMPAGASIKRHVDKGGYSADGHRVHVVLASTPPVEFHVCEGATCLGLHLEEGLVFELNNRLEHYVDNRGAAPRVHLVVDVAEGARERTALEPGEVCDYAGGEILCKGRRAGGGGGGGEEGRGRGRGRGGRGGGP